MRAFLLSLLILLASVAQAQVRPAPPAVSRSEITVGILGKAGEGAQSEAQGPFSGDVKRSIPLAFGLSAVLPGAGQAYNRQWVKAAVALGLEAAVFVGWSLTRNEGLQGEEDYQAFAHAEWSPVRYSSWLNDYVVYLGDEFGLSVSAPPAEAPTDINFANPGAWTSSERSRVDAFFGQMQAIERQVFHPETRATFSHQIPGFGEQQYYELIGKYFQFAPGWDDYPAWITEDGVFTSAIDPEQSGPGRTKPNVSPTFYRYAKDHAAAEDLLRTASRLSALFIVNHLIAGIDAAVTAKLRNDRIDASMALLYVPDGPPAPSLKVTFAF